MGAIASLVGASATRAQDVPGYGPAPGYGGAARTYGDPDAPPNTARHVTIDVIGDLIYDSNVARSDAAEAAVRHLSLSDEIFTPTAAIDAYLPVGREALFLHGNAGYDFHRVDTVLNRERIDLHGGGLAQFGPCQETLTGDFNRQQTDLEELEAQVTSNVQDTENVAFNATCGRRVGLQPFIGVNEQWADNSAAVLTASNRQTTGVTGGLGYARPALGTIQLFGQYSSTTFPDSDVVIVGVPRHDGYDLTSGGISFDHHVGARIEGTVSVSYTSLSLNLPGEQGFSGLTYSTAIVYRASGRLSADLHLTRATLPSDRIGASFTLDNLIIGDIHYKLGPRILLLLGASRDSRAFEGPPTVIIPINESTRDVEYTGFAAATYTLSRRIAFTLNFSQSRRDANVAAFSYDDTRVDLTASTAF